jgi:hypothetical protein
MRRSSRFESCLLHLFKGIIMAYEGAAKALGEKIGEALINHPKFPEMVAKRKAEIVKNKKQIEANEWEKKSDLDRIISLVKNLSGETKFSMNDDWCWVKNNRCKYVSLRIDMRDGAFVLLDRHNERITIEELEKQ